ncbi:M1 family metallopeptidase [Archangium primigenium]|uniref:M1 family metallopeptidase n=1 Tax=[Archangium] primigenium TaxID=2792470 RepID=UPI00195DFBF2|nr:M1 family metallopeptidase [Archangium primigenium]MBM7112790.1 M1 family metallopeptidase [Archangium primigenium]
MRWPLLVVLALAALRCAHAPEAAAVPPASATSWPEPQPPALRLPDTVRPVRYLLDLTLLPSEPTYSGTVTVDLDVRAPTQQLWLHAQDLTLTQARVRTGERVLEARTVDGGEGRLGVLLPEELPVGPAQLTLAFTGQPDRERSQGLYVVAENGEPAFYTFFEPVDARRAFPCFDEPGFKVPWRLRFTVKQEHVALANHAIESEEPLPGGLKRVTFADSRPMPSYLVAFMVGPFDIVEAGRVGRSPVPLRFIVPRGRGPETAYAARVTPRIVTLLEDFFDQPYPYEKLDVAVVPRFWGTMEHPGLVALGQPLTLIRPGEETLERRKRYVNIAIHELGHYWFSAMLTCRWWDDAWLNESLTSWLDRKLTDQFDPAWRHGVEAQSQLRSAALGIDARTTTPPVRKPIATPADIHGAFDNATTYFKGASLLGQLEDWVGEAPLREALRHYVRAHEWGSVTAEDFLGAMGKDLGPDAERFLRGYLDQPGAPRVSAELQCTPGQAPRLTLAQERYLPEGVTAPAPQLWSVPVCVRAEGRAERTCTLLSTATGALELPGTSCPAWVLLNAGGAGYYRSGYTAAQLSRLGALPPGALSLPERLTFLADVQAGVARGDLRLADTWGLVPATARDADRLVVQRGSYLAGLSLQALPEDVRPLYRAWMRDLYGARARELGWLPRPGESDDTQAFRGELLDRAAFVGEEPTLVREAQTLARAWLADRSRVAAETGPRALQLAARTGDAALFDALLDQAKKTQNPTEREQLLETLGSFQDPALVDRALALVTADTFDPRDSVGILANALTNLQARDKAWRFYVANFDLLTSRMRSDEANQLIFLVGQLCDDRWRAEAETVLAPRVSRIEGGERALRRALESLRLCVAFNRKQLPGVVDFLKNRAKPARR